MPKPRKLPLATATAFILSTAAGFPGPGHAAQPNLPNAGSILERITPRARLPKKSDAPVRVPNRPALQLPDGATFRVSSFRIVGATVFDTSVLQGLIEDAQGKTLGLTELNELCDRITRYYRNQGYLISHAYLPEQQIADGVVTIAVLEGKLEQIDIDNKAQVGGDALAPLQRIPTDTPLNSRSLNRALLLVSDVPGIAIRSALVPGEKVGTSNLVSRVSSTPTITGSVGVDNYGSRETGAGRLQSNTAINNPLGIGDQISLDLLGSDEGLYYAHAGYQAPVSSLGITVGGGYSHLRYKLAKNYAPLQAHGTADVATAYVTAPLVRQRGFSLYARLQYDHKQLDDYIDAFGLASHKELNTGKAGLTANSQDRIGGGGANALYVTVENGDLELDKASAAIDTVTGKTKGRFTKLAFGAIREQFLTQRTSLYVSYRGQHGFDNLDSAEQMSLGGAGGVRAYPQGYVSGDTAHLVTVEGRYQVPVPGAWQAKAFYDYGYARHNAYPWVAGSNHSDIGGAGVGVDVRLPHGVSLGASLAWRTNGTGPGPANDKNPRGLLAASIQF